LWWETRGTNDVELWLTWIRQLTAAGPRLGYVDLHADYPPGTSVVLWLIGRLASLVATDPRVVLKLGLLCCLLITTGTLLAASRRAGLSAFAHAALVLNSFGLMYLDIFTAPLVLGSIWAASAEREPLMAGLLAGACLMKWQPLLLVPFAAVHVLRSRTTTERTVWLRKAAYAAAIPASIAVAAILIYGFSSILDALDRAGHHNDLSNYGANPLWVLTWFFEWTAQAGKQSLSPAGLVTIMAASRPIIRVSSFISLIGYATILWKYWKSADRTVGGFVRFSLAGYLVYFLFSVGVHENHLFLASLLGIALAWLEPRQLWVAVMLAIAANLNLLVFYGWQDGMVDRVIKGVDVSVPVAIAISAVVSIVMLRLITSDQGMSRRPRSCQ
jgi:hypothetical protein